jgi:exodeoxyribonuclease VII small subunit
LEPRTREEAPAGPSGEPAGAPVPERYEEVVSRLSQIVEKLESGGLSLEEAVTAFEQGIRLARAGAARLDAAERRVEILLDGDRTQPFEPARAEQAPTGRAPPRPRRSPDDEGP